MNINIKHNNHVYFANLKMPIDISVPIQHNGIRAWGVEKMGIEPVKKDGWIGDVISGGGVNFNNIFFNPHAHSTHTECVGHISPKKESINIELKSFFFISKLITVKPKKKQGDCVITKKMLSTLISEQENIEALIIRTEPNVETKMSKNHTNTNPPYLLKGAAKYISEISINHLLVDLPSIDKENDEGELSAHKSFWQFPDNIRHGSTITELIYVPNNIADGKYLLNLQFVPFENDASPSRPILFKLEKTEKR